MKQLAHSEDSFTRIRIHMHACFHTVVSIFVFHSVVMRPQFLFILLVQEAVCSVALFIILHSFFMSHDLIGFRGTIWMSL
jgi:hypothetical protein